ncbi:MAG: hypothetical protein ACRC8M_07455 [Cetobacterium sp.]|uniref:hypothetical protein n=1 Tax=Cetobacterium sp. TaxID=2071632 RepID=UPI003F343927
MYINSKHLQILKVIKNNQVSTIKDISDIFLLSQQHTKLYLEDIYCELFFEPSRDLRSELVIEKIRNFSNAKNILKNLQQFTKNQKIFYVIFHLIKDQHIILSHICENLDLTKRNLNNYLDEISNILAPYNLKIKVTNKGLILLGTPFSIKNFKYYLAFKFLIEKDFLPKQLRNELLGFLKVENFYKLRKDISRFIKSINSTTVLHSEISLFCFYLAFKADEKEKKIADISLEDALKYKPKYYDEDYFYEIFNFLKNSVFKDLSSASLNSFFDSIDIFKCSKTRFEKFVQSIAKDTQPIFAKYIGNHIYESLDFFKIINPWISYSYLKDIFYVEDFTFLDLNLNYFSNSNIVEMTKEINQILPKFSIFESIFIWYYFSETKPKLSHNIFIFKTLPSSILPTLIEEIYKKHNIKISNYINIKEFNEYRKYNIIEQIITVENIHIFNNQIPIKNLYFPIPNFKKIVPLKA